MLSWGQQRSGTSALRPVTIAQCVNAEQAFADAEFFIDGAEVKDVSRECRSRGAAGPFPRPQADGLGAHSTSTDTFEICTSMC